jgi:hypothetical protein
MIKVLKQMVEALEKPASEDSSVAQQRTWVGLSMEQFEHFTSYVRADVLIEIEEALMENNT